jgi:Cytochrome c554 and c-prime
MSWYTSAWKSSGALCALLLGACGPSNGASDAPMALTREQLLDPAQCKGCHPQHYREWASSMHAYAAEDPVFLAMNRRGQRETGGELGDFCVRCHAPLALREGATSDGLNLDQVPAHLKGVTCYFCHNAIATGEAFNNHVELANDLTLRGAIPDPVPTAAHASAYSVLQDRNRIDSSELCGGCHDVVTPNGVHLERTFLEYRESLFATQGTSFDSCSGCHMPGRREAVASGGPLRTRHEHLWPGVDTALTEFPDREAQRRAVECDLSLNARFREIRQDGLGGLYVMVESSAGHGQPSGTALDRRMWLEVIAYDADDRVLFESGNIADGELEQKPADSPGFDPNLTLYRDWIYDAQGDEVHMFWEAAASADYPDGYASLTLPAPATLLDPHALEARYQIADYGRVKRITLRLRMRAVGRDVLEDLVHSGDLHESVLAAVPTFTLHGASVEYWPEDGSVVSLLPDELDCPDSYRCLLAADGCED